MYLRLAWGEVRPGDAARALRAAVMVRENCFRVRLRISRGPAPLYFPDFPMVFGKFGKYTGAGPLDMREHTSEFRWYS